MKKLTAMLLLLLMLLPAYSVGAVSEWTGPTISNEYQEYCYQIGEKEGIKPELLISMIESESNGDSKALGKDGDSGLLQVLPKYHGDRMQRLEVTDIFDPYGNIEVGADYLLELFQRYEDPYMVLMSYNMGETKASELYEKGIYSDYAVKILNRSYELERYAEGNGGTTYENNH